MKKHNTRNQPPPAELAWRRLVLGKWLNISANNSDYTADVDSGSESDPEFIDWPTVKNEKPAGVEVDTCDTLPVSRRRRKSETFRAQYINTKEIRICAATWNVGGTVPPDDLDLDSWLDIDDPAHIYVIGLQEMIPLNAGNIFGAEDNRPISRWENIIRETLNRVRPTNKYKSYSDPPSPSRFKPSEDVPDIIEEILESDSDIDEGIYTLNEDSNNFDEQQRESIDVNVEESRAVGLTKSLSGTERIGLSWPEPPLHLLPHVIERCNFIKNSKSFQSSKSFKTSKSFRAYGSLRSNTIPENRIWSDLASLAELDLESLINQTRRPPFVRIVSKQMVGVFITIWVRRSLRRHIQNLNVSTVGVGVMGYIGNKGSISVSMSIHQTLFCFVCTHLTSGEKETDAFKRNADVNEIHKRTRFCSRTVLGLPERIYDHEKIIWLGDLNYRVNLSYEKTRELVSRNDLSKLMEHDQLIKEFKKGHAFDGWSEGIITFAPTYKYELDSDSYIGGDPSKPGRRTPAWCDRILSFGTGMKLISYRRSEIKLSDHRPVTASYVVDVEVFSTRKLQKALTFTDAEIEEHDGTLDRSETR